MTQHLAQLVVVSGKGGTGKTSVLASFAALAENKVLADCDVDAANLHLLLHPEVQREDEFLGAKIAVRDPAKCRQAGECERLCRFDAITTSAVKATACEGCGLCVLACPNDALTLEPIVNGQHYVSSTRYGPMAHARLLAGAESSGKLVTRVRQLAEDLARESGADLVLIDGPPGIGCTATSAMAETSMALIVTEPTLSGMHDMARVCRLVAHFGIPMSVLINKADLNPANTETLRAFCAENDMPVVAELPFDETVTRAIAAQVPVVEYDSGEVSSGIKQAWRTLDRMLRPHRYT